MNTTDNIEILYGSLSKESKDMALEYTKLLATAEDNARRAMLKDLEEKVPDYTGKEHKQGYYENQDAHSSRPYMDTCLAALQLMVYYRYLPTTSVKAGADEGTDTEDAAKSIDKSKDVSVTVDI